MGLSVAGSVVTLRGSRLWVLWVALGRRGILPYIGCRNNFGHLLEWNQWSGVHVPTFGLRYDSGGFLVSCCSGPWGIQFTGDACVRDGIESHEEARRRSLVAERVS